MTATILRGDALALPLADESVDLVVTSPPYFGLRSYTDGGQHYAGQLGSEATPAEFVDALLAATREMVRVLKPSGSIWVNLGDKYATGDHPMQTGLTVLGPERSGLHGKRNDYGNIRHKSLLGIPWRYALACIDQLGLILRAEVIWSKPNGLPESVTDRVRRSHEQWFHLVRQPRYFSAVDEIREEGATVVSPTGAVRYRRPGDEHLQQGRINRRASLDRAAALAEVSGGQNGLAGGLLSNNPLGKLPGSVWTIPTEPLTVPPELGVDHFAAFPTEWPRRIISGWSPPGICTECGEGRRPVVAKELSHVNWTTHAKTQLGESMGQEVRTAHGRGANNVSRESATITGYVCACTCTDAPTRPAVVLDPFGGTGTVALVADVLGRHGIGVDLSADYCRLAAWRTADRGQRAKAMRVEKPPPVIDGQLSLEVGP